MEWLEQSWEIIATIIGAITLLWGFRKTIKEIKKSVYEPLDNVIKEINNIKIELSNRNQQQDKIIIALQSMQRRSLLDSFTKAINKGSLTINEKETLSKQVDSYKELNGNSFILSLWEEVLKLPIK